MTKMTVIVGDNDLELMQKFNDFSERIGNGLVSYESLDRLTMRVFYTEEPLKEVVENTENYGHPTCTGVCATCEWWTSANIGRRNGGRVKWGNCAILNGCATNEAQSSCGHYREVAR